MANPTGGPQLTLETERMGDTAVVRCHGRLVFGTGGILYAEVSQLIPGAKKIVLDLTDLSYMDSMGLGTIIRLYVSTKGAGGTLELINVGKRIMELLGVTQLLSVLTVVGENDIRMM
jgi:anti-sigma B factor antagonist